MTLQVCEIFHSLQGESTFAGLPCTFIRLSGCNLDCAWCDTPYARHESRPMTIDSILQKTRRFSCLLVEITGGEPLIQTHTPVLAERLIENGHTVLVETNGSRPIDLLPESCIRIMDIKCPSSNESGSFLTANLDCLTPVDEVKFVIGSETDYQYARRMIRQTLPSRLPPEKIHLSPVFGKVAPDMLAAWIIADRLNARLSLQMHKIIWNPEQRGV